MIVKKQAQRESGQILILPSDEEAGALSGRTSSLLSFQKGVCSDELTFSLPLNVQDDFGHTHHKSFSLPALRDGTLANANTIGVNHDHT